MTTAAGTLRRTSGSALEVFLAFLRLGLTSFGGPIAHIGFFRQEFVTRRGWLDDLAYADLVGLCQFLPGPASSQVGFSLGLLRAGALGGLAAWTGFTLPSSIALVLFAYASGSLGGALGQGLVHGLKLVAVAIIAQAVWGMARSLCPDRPRASVALAAALTVSLNGSSAAQAIAIAAGAVAGLWLCRPSGQTAESHFVIPVRPAVGILALAIFFFLLLVLPALPAAGPTALFNAFYRAGALVFGGGHVVLPLLRETVVEPGWISQDAFLAGYGAAQAVPGPLFTVAAYLGALASPSSHGVAGAAIGLVGIFLPGLLVLVGILPFWQSFRRWARGQAMMQGVNAAVVGILGAALYDPVWTGSVKGSGDFGLALTGFVLLTVWRVPPLVVVLMSAAGGLAMARLAMI